jgi:hypothetical protein
VESEEQPSSIFTRVHESVLSSDYHTQTVPVVYFKPSNTDSMGSDAAQGAVTMTTQLAMSRVTECARHVLSQVYARGRKLEEG